MQILNGKHVMCAVMVTLALAAPARSQTPAPPVGEPMSLSGPRFGMTVLSDGIVRKLSDENFITVAPVVSQFGWQFEKQWATGGGPAAVTEWVVLLGGLEQGVVLPSISWLAGLRTASGTEFGVGPNITPVGVGLVIAAGMTVRAGLLNIPFNVAVAPSKSGTRVSVITGFNMRRR